ncbi:MAG: RNA methyltransferase, TrmH family [Halanaerobium sp. 4-GBenrich]|uniref:RNA methyltransferase, TrmH family n=1 Tax=Halanaerobium congolense TaxID=54121 RepID=A0A1G6HU74_9FIRM|nr:RNA methyltransferase [Halanaerobium congolense]ODS50832.1 MAG: RNA methyltransferase, TrmH family [Halanaerobium sp. 4-GBenrich]TDS31767.1 TrmH family RNA methyltransferase [Halanaerobium congolense]SDB97857.1 RNA methyltransferase, TrmH family [Halanaerobium congolense]
MNIISSSQNDKVKYLNKLYRSRNRRKEGVFILEGKRLIEAASAGGADFKQVFLTPAFFKSAENDELLADLKSKAEFIYLKGYLLKEIASTVNPQGILAVVEESIFKGDDFYRRADKILLLDRIQDPGNMGTMIRTAVAAGFDGIIALKGSVDIYNQKVIRSTMGGIFSIAIRQKLSQKEFLTEIAAEAADYELLAADIEAEEYYFEHQYQDKLILMIGNEANGLDSKLMDSATVKIKIPLAGEIESLNASVAASVISFEILSQQLQKDK